MNEKKLDLPHLRRIAAILEALPAGTDLPHAIIAVEDAYMALTIALRCGLGSVEAMREEHRILVSEVEAAQGPAVVN